MPGKITFDGDALAASVAQMRALLIELESARRADAERIRQLENAVARLRSPASSAPEAPSDGEPRATGSRRQLLRRGAIAAGAGAAVALGRGRPAAANHAGSVEIDHTKFATANTAVWSSGPGADALHGRATSSIGTSWGVRGDSDSNDGAGVRGHALHPTGATKGVWGKVESFKGVGVYGEGLVAVKGESIVSFDGTGVLGVAKGGVSTGVRGESDTNYGVQGMGRVGVSAHGKEIGVQSGGDQFGGEFRGERAALHLLQPFVGGVPPRQRSDGHLAGELYVDNSDVLWWCVKAGTPGTWRSLAGPQSSGALHLLTPTRVYDSRFSDGPLAAGKNRVVSVANGIDIVTGAVNKKNLVPAGAVAVLFNLAVTGTVGGGFIAVTPGNAGAFGAASINWFGAGQDLNNGTASALSGNRQLRAWAGGGSAHFIVDVTGYTT